jgi:hypothetical protein
MMASHDDKMTQLAVKVSNLLEGEDMLDVATVCARIIAVAINDVYDDDRDKIRAVDRLIRFMLKDLEYMMKNTNERSRMH